MSESANPEEKGDHGHRSRSQSRDSDQEKNDSPTPQKRDIQDKVHERKAESKERKAESKGRKPESKERKAESKERKDESIERKDFEQVEKQESDRITDGERRQDSGADVGRTTTTTKGLSTTERKKRKKAARRQSAERKRRIKDSSDEERDRMEQKRRKHKRKRKVRSGVKEPVKVIKKIVIQEEPLEQPPPCTPAVVKRLPEVVCGKEVVEKQEVVTETCFDVAETYHCCNWLQHTWSSLLCSLTARRDFLSPLSLLAFLAMYSVMGGIAMWIVERHFSGIGRNLRDKFSIPGLAAGYLPPLEDPDISDSSDYDGD